MNILRLGHLVIGAVLVAFAVLSNTWILTIAGVAFAAIGWFALCPIQRVMAHVRQVDKSEEE
jgi:hypothetical protein